MASRGKHRKRRGFTPLWLRHVEIFLLMAAVGLVALATRDGTAVAVVAILGLVVVLLP